jgi:hypothetical protein
LTLTKPWFYATAIVSPFLGVLIAVSFHHGQPTAWTYWLGGAGIVLYLATLIILRRAVPKSSNSEERIPGCDT